jgi:uncharacterized protein (TIGR02145 family)
VLAVVIAFLSCFNGCKKEVEPPDDSAIKDIDGNIYTSVIIGEQEWLVQNLRTTRFRDGSAIPLVTEAGIWSELSTPAYCWYYNDKITFGSYYGALYNWYAVADSRDICPTGWHIPTDAEFTELETFLTNEYQLPNGWDDLNGIGNNLKSCRQINSPIGGNCSTGEHPTWNSHNKHFGTNHFGFAALPGGYRCYFHGGFSDLGNLGGWWCITEEDELRARKRGIYNEAGILFRTTAPKRRGYSVRCIKDK